MPLSPESNVDWSGVKETVLPSSSPGTAAGTRPFHDHPLCLRASVPVCTEALSAEEPGPRASGRSRGLWVRPRDGYEGHRLRGLRG